MSRPIDLMHLGRDRVICAYELDGVVVDPGPSTCIDALLAGLGGEPPRALLLTHIHLDHAGATGVLVRRFPELRVYVHERGAPHLVDPARLLASAAKLYGDDMEALWGEVAPVPRERITTLAGGEEVEGCRVAYTPGHASHHVSYLDAAGNAYVGDVAGVTVPPAGLALPPTPPLDIDLELWSGSLDTLAEWRPERLCLTHFGAIDAVEERILRMREALVHFGELARSHGRDAFLAALDAEVREAAAGDPGIVERFTQAAPPEQLWLGLERYWRKRAEASDAAKPTGAR